MTHRCTRPGRHQRLHWSGSSQPAWEGMHAAGSHGKRAGAVVGGTKANTRVILKRPKQ